VLGFLSWECVQVGWERVQKPSEDFPAMKKRTKTEPSVDRMAALYIGKTWIRVVTIEGDQLVALVDWRIEYTLRRNGILLPKDVRNERPGVNLSWSEFKGTLKELEH